MHANHNINCACLYINCESNENEAHEGHFFHMRAFAAMRWNNVTQTLQTITTPHRTPVGITRPSCLPRASTRHLTSASDLASQLNDLRQQERLALSLLRERVDSFIRHVERIMAKPAAVPPPESLLGSRQYICTERSNASARFVDLGNAILAHARDIREHCRDLEQEPYREWQPDPSDPFNPDSHLAEPNFVALQVEEKARKIDILARLKELQSRAALAKHVIDIATKDGVSKANAYMKEVESRAVLDRKTMPLSTPTPETGSKPSLVSSGWDDLQTQMELQLENEEAASKKKKR